MRIALFRPATTTSDGNAAAPIRPTCLQCGVPALDGTTFCRRCGLPYGDPPRADANLPSCPVCYLSVDDDGRIESRMGGRRLDLVTHIDEHRQFPVGDDDYLESLRVGDRIRIGRFTAPFDVVRHYLVTGSLDGGRRRAAVHNAIVTAMAQVARWGRNPEVFGDQPEWQDAREAVSALMDRYAQGRR
jgi:hypothetical protein